MEKTIAVIGAGISGLAIALRLSEKGFKVIVLEKQKIAGGIAASIPYKGCQMDIGPHILILPKSGKIHDEIVNKIGESNLTEIFWPWAESFTSKGFFHKSYPLFYDILLNFGLKYFVKGSLDILKNKIKNSINNSQFKNAEEYFIGTYGEFLYSKWFKPFFSVSCFELKYESVEFAKEIFHPINLHRIITFIKKRISSIQNPYNPSNEYFNCYPKNGMGYFIQKIVDDIIFMNGQIILNADIKSISHDEDSKLITYTLNEKEHTINVDGIVYSTPFQTTLQWFPSIPLKIENIVKKTHAFNSIMVFLLVESSLLFDKWIITIYDSKSIIFRISQQNYLSKNICPKNTTLLCIEIQTSDNDNIETLEDSQILELVKKEIKRISRSGIGEVLIRYISFVLWLSQLLLTSSYLGLQLRQFHFHVNPLSLHKSFGRSLFHCSHSGLHYHYSSEQ